MEEATGAVVAWGDGQTRLSCPSGRSGRAGREQRGKGAEKRGESRQSKEQRALSTTGLQKLQFKQRKAMHHNGR